MLTCLDYEAHLIQPGSIPKAVCMAYYHDGDYGLVTAEDAIPLVFDWLQNPKVKLLGHNIRFDLAVFIESCSFDPWLYQQAMALVFEAYEHGRVACTLVRELLIHIANGQLQEEGGWSKAGDNAFSLEALVRKYLKEDISHLKGADSWRLRYCELDGVPLEEWPDAALQYPISDVLNTWSVHQLQANEALKHDCLMPDLNVIWDERAQCKAHFALQFLSLNGVGVDTSAVARLAVEVQEIEKQLEAVYMQHGLMVKGKRNLKAIQSRVHEAYTKAGLPVPTSDSGKNISYSRETMAESGDSVLEHIATLTSNSTLASTFLPALLAATDTGRAYPYWNVLVASGRLSCAKPNLTNQPRKGKIRQSWVPRRGYYFVAADYSMAELCSLAQVCFELFGYSEMGDAINEGKDLHIMLAADMRNITYEQAVALYQQDQLEERQAAKGANFGFPGGAGAASFIKYLKQNYGIVLDPDPNLAFAKSKQIKDLWLNRWSEMRLYFEYISKLGEPFKISQLFSGRVRGGLSYCSGANTLFQGLTADGVKEALWLIVSECYTGYSRMHPQYNPVTGLEQQPSPLYGCRVVACIHDEMLLEVPEDQAQAAAKRLVECMRAGMGMRTPKVQPRIDPVIMDRWYKGAKSKVLSDGTLEVYRGGK